VSTSNVTASGSIASFIGGQRQFVIPVSSTLSPGRYWLAWGQNTTTSNLSQLVNVSQHYNSVALVAYQPFGASSQVTNHGFLFPFEGLGGYSAQTSAFPGSVPLNTNAINANGVTGIMVRFNLSGYTTGTNML